MGPWTYARTSRPGTPMVDGSPAPRRPPPGPAASSSAWRDGPPGFLVDDGSAAEPATAATPPSERRHPARVQRVLGTVLAVSVTALVVAYPIVFAALFAVIEWTGCFIECREPDPNPAGAVAAGLVALLLLGLPVLVGILSWRGSSRRLVLVYLGLAALAAVSWVLGVAI